MSRKPVQTRCLVGIGRQPTGKAPGKAHGAAVGLLPHKRPRAYTLIEVMIVAVIVVLMLGMALPVFRAITGSRSEAGASNLIASMLGRARTDAIGLDKPIGVAVVYNPSTQLSYLAEVGFADCPAWVVGQYVNPGAYVSVAVSGGYVYYYINRRTTQVGPLPVAPASPAQTIQSNLYPVGGAPLDILPDTDLLPLPTGIGVQTICNGVVNSSGQRLTDGYLSFGVILFDGSGRMISQNYGVSYKSALMTGTKIAADYPSVGGGTASPGIYNNGQFGIPSQFGLVVFQQEAFNSQKSPTPDPAYSTANNSQQSTYTGTGSPTPQAEENWLDQNATPLLIDRYTGTLIKAE